MGLLPWRSCCQRSCMRRSGPKRKKKVAHATQLESRTRITCLRGKGRVKTARLTKQHAAKAKLSKRSTDAPAPVKAKTQQMPATRPIAASKYSLRRDSQKNGGGLMLRFFSSLAASASVSLFTEVGKGRGRIERGWVTKILVACGRTVRAN